MNVRSLTLFLVLVACLAGCASSAPPAADSKSQDAICRSYSLSNNPDVTPPRRIRGDQPTPPANAKSGYACVRVTITESGSVIEPVVVKTDNQEFAEAFVRALSGWQYSPATRGSAKVVYHTVVLAHFP
jgi:hypothetical protein